ncbi:hypothetical protein [Paenibacillus pinihumi]|uniref:hypothetical protein n=1 Tax=Paenibacillus pinihumi TaxID=669462 RepID=UPI000409B811|nr:hypothetical protein [Paenibacillus pinihumi]
MPKLFFVFLCIIAVYFAVFPQQYWKIGIYNLWGGMRPFEEKGDEIKPEKSIVWGI